MSRRQPKNADKTRIFAKEKPKPNTFVFDLGFDWRKEWDSLRDIISLHLLPLGSSYTSLIFIISLSLSRARKFICIVKMKTGYSRFPQAGVLRLDFRYRSNANDGNELPRYYIPTSFRQNKRTHMFLNKGILPFPFSCFCNKFKPCKTEYLFDIFMSYEYLRFKILFWI